MFAGVLVQVGVNATAAGVLSHQEPLRPEDNRSYTINAKRGLGLSVVVGTTVPEQVLYDTGNFGTKIHLALRRPDHAGLRRQGRGAFPIRPLDPRPGRSCWDEAS